MAKYILSAFADEVSPVFKNQLEYLTSREIKFIEPRNIDGTNVSSLTPEQASDAKKLLDSYGIGVSSIGSPVGKISVDDDFAEHLKLFENTLDVARTFEAKNIRMFSFFYPENTLTTAHRDAVMARLEILWEMADKKGITLCHENEKSIYGETPESCLDIMKHFNGKIKSVFDMGNFAFCKQDPLKGYDALEPYIEYIHIKDAFYDTRIVPAGNGDGKVYEILDRFDKYTDRDVFLTLEPHLTVFSGLEKLSNLNDITVGNAYETPEAAFDAAITALKTILDKIGK
ncbi:MAG: xylose isomerase [Clostridiales bacterium]|nr:MAG: xylose isomerase [Clostridiales bacterium]